MNMNSTNDPILMLDVKETTDQLAIDSSIRRYGHVLGKD